MSRRPEITAHVRRRGEAGFTFAEVLVTLVIVVVIILGVLAMFDLNSRVARTQTHVSEMQQSQRVAQQTIIKLARMAGRGGLPVFDAVADIRLPRGVALGIDNNIASGTQIGGSAAAQVLPGTDVLIVRGILTAPLYISNPESQVDFVPPPDDGGAGSLTLKNLTDSGAPQDLSELAEAVADIQGGGSPDALIMANDLGQYVVVQITGGSQEPANPPPGTPITEVTVNFTNSGGAHSDAFNALSLGGAYDPNFQRVAYAGILEEYRFFVHDQRANQADDTANPRPQLVRARLVPNTNSAWQGDDANLTEVIADNILDLQLAFGVDRDGDDLVEEGTAGAGAGELAANDDDWLFNDPGDSDDADLWNVEGGDLFYLRINTLARTDRPTPKYLAEDIDSIEDNDWGAAPFARFNEDVERAYQRRQIRTVVDLRNL